jgi:hypothetical protein
MSGRENAGSRSSSLPPALIGLDEFQLAIPWRGGLHQSPPPLHQPGQVCGKLASLVEDFQRTAKYLLTGCLTPGGKCKVTFDSSFKRGLDSAVTITTIVRGFLCNGSSIGRTGCSAFS